MLGVYSKGLSGLGWFPRTGSTQSSKDKVSSNYVQEFFFNESECINMDTILISSDVKWIHTRYLDITSIVVEKFP